MANLKFNEGDIVQLKSGGPKMTVHKYKINVFNSQPMKDSVICQWFDDKNEQKAGTFHEDQLELAE